MAAYKPTMSYRLIYIFTIHDAQHEGYWKIGKTNFDSVNSYKQLPPNCAELNCAARDRIDQYTKTVMVEYEDRKSTRLNSSHRHTSRMPSSA